MSGRFVVMGVAGSGKSRIGAGVAAAIGARFIDGDDLHPAANIAKMSRGEPLTDADRAPWLDRVGQRLAEAETATVIACSALKRAYRQRIRARAGGAVTFLYLHGSRETLLARLAAREDHFMPASLLDSQLAALEPPQPDEQAVRASIEQPPEAVIAALLAAIGGSET